MPTDLVFCNGCLSLEGKMRVLRSEQMTIFKQITQTEIPNISLCFICDAYFKRCCKFSERARRAETVILLLAANDCLNKQKLRLINRVKVKLNSNLSKCNIMNQSINTMSPDNEVFEIETEIKQEINVDEEDWKPDKEITEKESENIFVETNEVEVKIEKREKRRKRCREKKKSSDMTIDCQTTLEDCQTFLSDNSDCDVEFSLPLKKIKSKALNKKKEKHTSPKVEKKPLKKGRRRRLEEYVDIIDFTMEQQLEEMNKRRLAMERSKANFKCNMCFKIFREEKTFSNHHRMEHDESIGPYVCDFCQVRRKSKHKLYVHICSHLRAYVCKQCGFQSKHGYQATMHKEYHDGKLYICEKCGRTYKRPGAYYSHMRFLHASTFVCDVCGENFLSEAGLALHKKKSLCIPNKVGVSDASGPEVAGGRHCAECDVTFVTDDAWRRHMVTSDKHNLPYVKAKRSGRKKKKGLIQNL